MMDSQNESFKGLTLELDSKSDELESQKMQSEEKIDSFGLQKAENQKTIRELMDKIQELKRENQDLSISEDQANQVQLERDSLNQRLKSSDYETVYMQKKLDLTKKELLYTKEDLGQLIENF